MKKNLKLIITIIGVIFLVGIGITVAYYSVTINGNPTSNNIEIGALVSIEHIRLSIALVSTAKIDASGTGTKDNPYVVVGM